MTTHLPLSGIRVVDFTQVMLGPCCTQMLGDYGADVVKIERPGVGDLSRTAIEDPLGLDNPMYLSLNRNKRSVAVDLSSEAGTAVVHDLIRRSDVVVHNFRPGVMERLGFGYDELSTQNPALIWAAGSGFGTTGPYVHKGGQDVLAQAYTGVMARKADPAHPLAVYATALADFSAGMHLFQGILLAHADRARTGLGQRVDVSLYSSMLAMQMAEATVQLMRGIELNWAAMPLTGVFRTTDGAVVLVGAFRDKPLREICKALDLPDLSLEERFGDFAGMVAHRSELQRIMQDRFATNTTGYWLGRLEDHDLLCAPVQTLSEALDGPQTAAVDILVEYPHPSGEIVRSVGSPITMSRAAAEVRLHPPRLGEHTEELLTELGYGRDRIDALRSGGVIA